MTSTTTERHIFERYFRDYSNLHSVVLCREANQRITKSHGEWPDLETWNISLKIGIEQIIDIIFSNYENWKSFESEPETINRQLVILTLKSIPRHIWRTRQKIRHWTEESRMLVRKGGRNISTKSPRSTWGSMPRRTSAVLAANGGNTKYWTRKYQYHISFIQYHLYKL